MTVREAHIFIGDRRIGANEPCYVIAEAGINHNGDLDCARRLIDAAVAGGADAVKFQKRKLTEVYQEELLKQPRLGEQALQYLVPLLVEFELSDSAFRELDGYCAKQGITFLCTPWDTHSVDFLEELRVPAYKIGSPDMTNLPLLDYVLRTGKPIIVSTGMSTEDEIRRTIAFLAERNAQCALLHCVSTYPAAPEEINLRFMAPALRRGILGITASALLASNLRTIDPVSKWAYGTFPVGKHEMLTMTSISGECCARGLDQLVYSLEFTVLQELEQDALASIAADDSTVLVVPDSASWYYVGALDATTHQRTLRRDHIVRPTVIPMQDINRGISRPSSEWFVAFPNGRVERAVRDLAGHYVVGKERTLWRGGYSLSVYPLTMRDSTR
jgi:sialic acid synthase SpsE